MARYIATAEVAKMIRRQLKAAYPRVTFSVKTRRGSSVSVKWTDGPTRKMVEAITNQYRGRGFDGSIDMEYSIDHWLAADGSITVAYTPGTVGSRGYVERIEAAPPAEGAELVHFGSGYISCERNYSAGLKNRALDKLRATLAFDIDVSDVTFAEQDIRIGGEIFRATRISRDTYVPGWNTHLSDLVNREAERRCAGL